MTQFGNSTKFNTRMNGEMIIAHTNDMGSATIVLIILENVFMFVSFPDLTHYYCKATTKNVNGFLLHYLFPKEISSTFPVYTSFGERTNIPSSFVRLMENTIVPSFSMMYVLSIISI